MQTLWDLVKNAFPKPAKPAPKPRAKRERPVPRPAAAPAPAPAKLKDAAPSRETMDDRYDRITRQMLEAYGVRVRRWRSGMSGIAWEVVYHDGRVNKLIESPRPKGPMSAAVFLHEIGHHAIGFGIHRPRCLEEYHAWAFSLSQMELLGLNVTDAVRRRMHDSLHYAISKARRRGLRQLPGELLPFVKPWGGVRRGRGAERRGRKGQS